MTLTRALADSNAAKRPARRRYYLGERGRLGAVQEIKLLIRDLGINPHRLAVILGCAPDLVYKWRAGAHQPSALFAMRLLHLRRVIGQIDPYDINPRQYWPSVHLV